MHVQVWSAAVVVVGYCRDGCQGSVSGFQLATMLSFEKASSAGLLLACSLS